jgi:hypothetical protein
MGASRSTTPRAANSAASVAVKILGNAAQAKAMRWRGGDIKLQVHCSERFGPENFIARATAIDKAAMGLAAMSSRTMVRAPRAVFWVRHRRRWQARRW